MRQPAGLPGDLRDDTSVSAVPGAPGRYVASLSDRWSYLFPSGGVLMTLALRAIAAELDHPDLRPVGAHATFCSALPAGPVTIEVTVLRRGRRASQARAALRALGAAVLGLEVTATFGVNRELSAFDVAAPERPGVPWVDACPALEGAEVALPAFYRNFAVRLAHGELWWQNAWTPGEPMTARWFRYRRPQVGADGALDPLAIPPIADTMASAFHRAVGSHDPPVYAPSLDLTVHFLEPAAPGWLLVVSRCRRARAGYVTGDAEIWTEDGRLVAVCGQTMFVRAPRAHL